MPFSNNTYRCQGFATSVFRVFFAKSDKKHSPVPGLQNKLPELKKGVFGQPLKCKKEHDFLRKALAWYFEDYPRWWKKYALTKNNGRFDPGQGAQVLF